MHLFGAERLDGQCGRQRRIDPAGEPDDDVAETVLADVVGEPELERLAHLLEVVERRRERSAQLDCLLSRRRKLHCDRGRGSAGYAPTRVGQPPRDDRRGIEVDHDQRLLEAGCACDHLAFVVDHDRMPVEDQLVLAADRVAQCDGARVVASAAPQHLLTLAVLAHVERGRRKVRDQLRAGQRQLGCRRPGLPDVLADRRPEDGVAEAQQHQILACREVALLVEDAVVWEQALFARQSGADLRRPSR